MKASIEYFGTLPGLPKTLIIGDMRELGKHSGECHKSLVEPIIKSGVKKVICIGSEIRATYDLLPKEIEKYIFPDIEALKTKLSDLLGKKEFILIKASNSVKLIKVPEFIKTLV